MSKVGLGEYGFMPGKPRVVSVTATSAGAGNTDAILQPGAGEIWVVVWALAFHEDDHAARNSQWRVGDAATDAGLYTTASDAASVYRILYTQVTAQPLPFVLDENTRLFFRVVDCTAAHNVQLRALVHVIKGVPVLE